MHGIDVSNNNPTSSVDWIGVEFVGIKASEGVDFTDRLFDTYVQTAIAKNIPWFPYHFAHPDVHSAADEAAFFLSKFSTLSPPWPPALDFETRGNINPLAIMGVDAAAAWIDDFLTHVESAVTMTPLFYTFRSYADVLYPRVEPRWLRWLASAVGHPQYTSYGGYDIAIEQWGQEGGIDVNESYIQLGGSDMTDEQAIQLGDIFQRVQALHVGNWVLTTPSGAYGDLKWLADQLDAAFARHGGGGSGGLTDAQVRAIVRDELDKTKLGT